MSEIEFVDRHEAKIKSITMEAPEGYEFGHIVKAEVEMRVGSLQYTTDKEGNMVRTATLVVEGCHIKEAVDPANQFAAGPSTGVTPDPDDDDDDAGGADDDAGDASDASPEVERHDGSTAEVDTATGEVREPVGAGVGGGNASGDIDPDVGF